MESLTRNELLVLLRYHAEYQFGPDPDRIMAICEAIKTAPETIEHSANTARFPLQTRAPGAA